MRHVLLYEPDPSGHRLVYVRYIAEAMARHGEMRATLVTSQRVADIGWIVKLQQRLGCYLSLHVVDEPASAPWLWRLSYKLGRQAAHTRRLSAAVRMLAGRETVDHVFIPFLDDYCLLPFALRSRPFGGLLWSGIAIRPRYHFPSMGTEVPRRKEDWVEGWAYRRILRDPSLATLFSIDPLFVDFVGEGQACAIGDPADMAPTPHDDNWLSAPAGAVIVLVYGYIDQRKAVDRLLAALCDPSVPPALGVALVGEQDPAVRPLLEGADARALRDRGRLIEVPRRVNDVEEAAAFARADIVWSFYPGNYCSSGAMVRAGRTGRPVMTTAEGLCGLLTKRAGSGLVAPEGDQQALVAQLARLARDADLRGTLGQAGRRRFSGNTGAAFGETIVRSLTERPSASRQADA